MLAGIEVMWRKCRLGCSMFRKRVVSGDLLARFEEIENWLRERFDLVPHDVVLVSQEPPRHPGFPPSETLIVFWKGEERYRLRIFKSAFEVERSDMPLAWLLPSLLDDGAADCC